MANLIRPADLLESIRHMTPEDREEFKRLMLMEEVKSSVKIGRDRLKNPDQYQARNLEIDKFDRSKFEVCTSDNIVVEKAGLHTDFTSYEGKKSGVTRVFGKPEIHEMMNYDEYNR